MKDPIASTFSKILYYFLPVFFATLTFFISFAEREFPWLWWGYILFLFFGSHLLDKGKILGMVPGILLGIYVILDDLKPPRVGPTVAWIGIVLIIYYLICGIHVFIRKRKAAKNI